MIEARQAIGATASQGSDNKSIMTTVIPTLVQTSTFLFIPRWNEFLTGGLSEKQIRKIHLQLNLVRMQMNQSPDKFDINCCHFKFVTLPL